MQTAKETLREFRVDQMIQGDVMLYIMRAMEQYAIYACKEQREICADEYSKKYYSQRRTVDAILNAPQPQLL